MGRVWCVVDLAEGDVWDRMWRGRIYVHIYAQVCLHVLVHAFLHIVVQRRMCIQRYLRTFVCRFVPESFEGCAYATFARQEAYQQAVSVIFHLQTCTMKIGWIAMLLYARFCSCTCWECCVLWKHE